MPSDELDAFELIGAGSTEDGEHVILSGRDKNGQEKLLAIPRERIPDMVALLVDAMNRAGEKANWQPVSNLGRNEKGPWMRVTGAGLFDGARPDAVRLVFEVDAMRFQFELRKNKCREVGTAFVTASAEELRRN